jgi:hypothetical protein
MSFSCQLLMGSHQRCWHIGKELLLMLLMRLMLLMLLQPEALN